MGAQSECDKKNLYLNKSEEILQYLLKEIQRDMKPLCYGLIAYVFFPFVCGT